MIRKVTFHLTNARLVLEFVSTVKVLPISSFFMENLERRGINYIVKQWYRKVLYMLNSEHSKRHTIYFSWKCLEHISIGSSPLRHTLGNDGKPLYNPFHEWLYKQYSIIGCWFNMQRYTLIRFHECIFGTSICKSNNVINLLGGMYINNSYPIFTDNLLMKGTYIKDITSLTWQTGGWIFTGLVDKFNYEIKIM